MVRTLVAMTLALGVCACATTVKPAVAVVPAAPVLPPPPTFAQKQSWILRLEDRRMLRDPTSESTPSPAEIEAATTLPSQPPDLLRLLTDDEARIRRRAALAVGRVGLREGVPALIPLLADTDPEVRQMAAFALGLLADGRAHDSLIAALVDSSPLVRGSAAEALGLIGDPSAAGAIAQMASQAIQAGPFTASGDGDDRDTPSAAFRLALSALVRLKAYDSLASVVFDASGQVRERSWPVAFALQRLEDPRALPGLLALAVDADLYTRAFAVKGLGALGNRSAVPVILPLVSSPDRWVAIEAIRALGRLGDPATAPALVRVIQSPKPDPTLRLEAVSALGGIAGEGVVEVLLDLVADPSPYIRAAVLRSLGQLDPETLIPVLSGLDPDPDWRVRLALATVLGTLSPEAAVARLRSMLQDTDQRVVAAVVPAFAKLRSADGTSLLMERLKVEDAVVRAAAATAIGELKPPGGASALAEAYRAAVNDTTYVARASSLSALSKYGSADAVPMLTEALQDTDWAVRVRAAALLKELDPASDTEQRIRPAPTMLSPDVYSAERLVNPVISPQVYIETDRGTIQLELAVLDAPLTVENFVTLARKGFFDGLTLHRVVPNFVVQTGDPRGDSEGGPGFTIRDELNERAYLRGTVGMALDWADTGGSQFFITHSPQPHLDAKYTVFGRVVSGMDVVDQIEPGDVMRRVRVWDGTWN